jgi:transmembrane sensor
VTFMPPSDPIDPLIEQATEWLLRLDEESGDPALPAAAEAWRAESAEHARAWKRAERAWNQLALRPVAAETTSPTVAVASRARFAGKGRIAAAVSLVAVLLLVAATMLSGPRADFTTATAELRQVTLQDGTRVDLSPQTALDVSFAGVRRTVKLLAGEAFFEVTPDATRPFEVQAGELAVKVVGTAFDVRMTADSLTVGVAHGAVETRYPKSRALLLAAGDQVTVDRRSAAVRQGRIAPEEVASWRGHQLFVENASVEDVAADIRRYSGKWIVFQDGRIAAQRVTGLYDLRDPDRALRVLVGPFGGRVREVTPYLRIVSGP